MREEAATTDQLELQRTRLAVERTRAAAERTLMAWIRTTLAMMSFGFGTFKLFQYLVPDQPGPGTLQWMTIALVAWGTLLMVGGIVQYSRTDRNLRNEHDLPRVFPLVLLAAGGVALFGIAAFTDLLLDIYGRI